jgi:hypothetical protein
MTSNFLNKSLKHKGTHIMCFHESI